MLLLASYDNIITNSNFEASRHDTSKFHPIQQWKVIFSVLLNKASKLGCGFFIHPLEAFEVNDFTARHANSASLQTSIDTTHSSRTSGDWSIELAIYHYTRLMIHFILLQKKRLRLMVWGKHKSKFLYIVGDFVRGRKRVGTVLTCSRRIFSLTNFNQSHCRILVFASRRANKVAKCKIGFTPAMQIFFHSFTVKTTICKEMNNDNSLKFA